MKKTLLLICLSLPIILPAQEKLVKNGNKPESEITAIANPQNPDQLIVAAMHEEGNSGVRNQTRLSIYHSSNKGDSWSKSVYDGKTSEETAETLIIGDPVLTYDAQGTAYLGHISWEGTNASLNTQLLVAQSTDGGVSWTPEVVRSGTQEVYDKPWITTDLSATSPYYNQVYLTFSRVDVVGNQSQSGIYLVRKEENAQGFSSQTVKVNTGEFRVTQFSNIITDNTGKIYVCFVGNDGSQTGAYVARSDDGGQSFLPEKQIVRLGMYYSNFGVLTTIINQKGLERLYPCPQIAVDRSGGDLEGRVYLTWTDIEENPIQYGLDIFLSYSDDRGNSWSTPTAMHTETPINNHQFYASLNVHPNGLLLMSWYDRRDDTRNENTHYYFALSRDGGMTLEENEILSSKSSDFNRIGGQNNDFGIGEYARLITSGEYALAFWADGRTNNGDINIYMGKILVDETTSIFEGVNVIDTSIRLFKSFPNPSTDRIRIELLLEKSMEIGLSLYDTKGSKVANIINKRLPIGAQQIDYQLDNIPAGIYTLHLETPFGISSRKVQIVR